MNFLRKHWYDLGGWVSIPVLLVLYFKRDGLTDYELLVWLSFVSLLFHQLEEYRVVGTFPGMVNRVMYHSDMPDRYPLNPNTSVYINVWVGWTSYLLAAILGEKAVWLGIATILVSAGNMVAHTVLFNLKGKTFYNAGMATSLLLFLPCLYFFFSILHRYNLATGFDYLLGIPLGIIFNIGVLKLIDWCAETNTPYVFEQRNLLRQDRGKLAGSS